MSDQFELQNAAGTTTHLLEDDGNATHSGTATANALVATTSVTAASAVIGGATVRGGQIKDATIAGGAAGDHTVTGVAADDVLVSVIEFASGVPTSRTSEFSITGANTINNTGGTDTTGDTLLVLYIDVSA